MRAIVAAIPRFAAALVFAICVAGEANATSIAPLTVDQKTDASAYIVRGQVTRVWTEVDADDVVWTRAELTVSRVFKGPDEPATLIVDSIGGRVGDFATWMDGTARFSEGENVLVFLASIKDDRLTPVGAFTGKYTIRRPPHETRSIAIADEVSPSMKYDARFLPLPARETWVFVDDLEGAVQGHLVAGWDGRPIPGISPAQLQTINAYERRAH